MNNIINIGREYYMDFEFQDILMPYLEEKSGQKILTEMIREEEKNLLNLLNGVIKK